MIGARWLLRRDGLGATNHFETCGFIRSRAGIPYPDIQYHFLPLAISYDGQSLATEHGMQAHVGPMRSKSRGWVRLRSTDPLDKPRVFFNYLSHPDDREEMRACVRLTREIFAQPAFAPYRGREIQPGADIVTDEQIDAFVAGQGRERLPPLLHLPHGRSGRSDGGGGPRDAGDRVRGLARRRQFHHAERHDRQSERADDHDRREGGRPYPWAPDAGAVQCAILLGAELADRATLSGCVSLQNDPQ